MQSLPHKYCLEKVWAVKFDILMAKKVRSRCLVAHKLRIRKKTVKILSVCTIICLFNCLFDLRLTEIESYDFRLTETESNWFVAVQVQLVHFFAGPNLD